MEFAATLAKLRYVQDFYDFLKTLCNYGDINGKQD